MPTKLLGKYDLKVAVFILLFFKSPLRSYKSFRNIDLRNKQTDDLKICHFLRLFLPTFQCTLAKKEIARHKNTVCIIKSSCFSWCKFNSSALLAECIVYTAHSGTFWSKKVQKILSHTEYTTLYWRFQKNCYWPR